MAGFVALHLGAGYHSESLLEAYQKLCSKACKRGKLMLKNGSDALEVVTAVTETLENSPLTNAGYGSTLTWDGQVECDASVMDGSSLLCGAVGAVPDVKNPVKLAEHLCRKQSGQTLALGRITPSLLVGEGAYKWAKSAGIPTVAGSMLISEGAKRRYLKYKSKLERYHSEHNQVMTPLETVGVVCIDARQHVASACSSGGIPLKHSGRVGQAAVFGCGCWAVDANDDLPAVATCTSGSGEYLVRTTLAKEVADHVKTSECCATGLHDAMTNKFLNSSFLKNVRTCDKLGGVIVLRYMPKENCGDFLWAHTTKTMIVSCMSVTDKVPKTRLSSLPRSTQVGSIINVEGVSFKL